MHKFFLKSKESFSLIEVLIFITILSLFFVVAAAVVTISLHNMKYNEHKIIATRYAEELTNFIKNQKDINWMNFTTYGDSSGIYYCFNSNPIWPPIVNTDCASTYGLNSKYKRYTKITTVGSSPISSVKVEVNVSWLEDNSSEKTVKLNSIYQAWE